MQQNISHAEPTQGDITQDSHDKNTSRQTHVENTCNSDAVHGINGAGASTSFNSMWAERWRELEELEVRRRQALDKQMQEAKLKLEAEMNRAKMEQEILSKRRQIEQQQAELHQLEQMYEMVSSK
jgi:hypothetical protein